MKKTLYVSDLDGTLLQPGGVLSDFARNTLNRLLDQGLLFTVATGRQLLSIQEVLRGLNLRLPIIEKDGAFVSDLHSGQHYAQHSIARETAVDILDVIMQAGHAPFINTYNGTRHGLCYQHSNRDGFSWYLRLRQSFKDPRLIQTDLLQTVCSEHTIGFIVLDKEAVLQPLFDELMSRFPGQLSGYVQPYHDSPGFHWLVIHHEASQKDRGIMRMRELEKLSDVELVTFGDQVNDLPMLLAADRAYAMGNGDAAVHEVADAIIGSNSQDSVVRFILEEWESALKY